MKIIENLIHMYKLPSVILVLIIVIIRFYLYAIKNKIEGDFNLIFLEATISLDVFIIENKCLMNNLLILTSSIIYLLLFNLVS